MTGWLVRLCLGISGVIILLLAYITRESLAIEKRRSKSEAELQESHEKYAALVEATTEGTLMVLNERCAYSNATMAETLGYTEEELSRLDFRDLFPPETDEPNSALAIDKRHTWKANSRRPSLKEICSEKTGNVFGRFVL